MKSKKVIVTGGSGFIGKHLIKLLTSHGYQVLNLDINSSGNKSISDFRKIDIRENLDQVFHEYQPDYVINLAAETSVQPTMLSEFTTNIQGVENLVATVNRYPVKKVLFFSTQYVYQGYSNWQDYDTYDPFTVYGESKMIGEQIVQDHCSVPYLILRPTNIWGENNMVYVNGLFSVMNKGYYFHPNKKKVLRSYGYIINICNQTMKLMESDSKNRKYYLSDKPLFLYDFISQIEKKINGKTTKTLPVLIFRIMAKIGDLFKFLGLGFPMNSTRLTNMTVPNPIPIKDTLEITGEGPISVEDAIERTAKWYKNLPHQ